MIRLLVDSFADDGLLNAQMSNAREIIRRLDPQRFHVSMFRLGVPDPLIAQRPNTAFIQLPKRRQTVRIIYEFLWGKHDILFYLKSSPASRYYLGLRKKWRDDRIVIGTMESQADMRMEPTIRPEAVRLWERTVPRCDYIFSNSRSVQRSLRQEYGLGSGVIPTGVDTKFFTPSHREPNVRPRVLFAGALRPFKGPQLVLDAARMFPYADFALAGDGMMRAELQSRVERDGLNNVGFLGLLQPVRLREEYRKADIFLFPSKWEGSPKVILEAAACGLPVIARQNYEPETVIDGCTGYLADSDARIFERLEHLLHDPQHCHSLGAAARKHSEGFDWDVISRQWEETFMELASKRGDRFAA